MAIYRVWDFGGWKRRAWPGQYIGGKNKVSFSGLTTGRNKLTFRPKMKHRPFLQITLSTKPLGLEEGPQGRNVTCQYVMIRRKKSASKTKTSTTTTPVVPTDSTDLETAPAKVVGSGHKTKGKKRKSEGSQGSGLDPTRGGKKRKK
jgi:hypothetical protein